MEVCGGCVMGRQQAEAIHVNRASNYIRVVCLSLP